MKEFVDFLGAHSPFDVLGGADLERLAERIEVEYFVSGAVVVTDGQPALDHFWLIRSGAVEVLDRGRVVDLLGPGDTFGHVSLLSGQPPTLSVRAAEDTLCFRLPDPREVVERPDRLKFDFYGSAVVREGFTASEGGLREKAHLPVTRFVRPLVRCEPKAPIRDVARQVTDARSTCALVEFRDGLGIVTDMDFRRRVATGEIDVGAPIHRIARRPARTVSGDTTVATALLEMVEHDLRHLIVLDDEARPVGVLRVVDLASSELRDPLVVRGAVEKAGSVKELAEACRLLPPTAVELFDTGVPPVRIGALLAVVLDAVLRRLLELDREAIRTPTASSWLVLGSLARREPLPTSDIDTALIWDDPEPGEEEQVAVAARAAASNFLDDMERCGLPRCHDGANADDPRFGRSLADWERAASTWVRDLSGDGALLLATMLADSRPLNEVALGRAAIDRMLAATRTPQFRKALLEYTLSSRPPIGFVRNLVVEHSGEHRGQLSLKRGGLRPVTSLSRWVAVMTGDTHGTTSQRLRRGAAEGLLTADESESLVGAHEHLYGLLLQQEVAAIRAGEPASTYLDPGELDSLSRRHLRESFRAIAHVQDRLGSQWMARWA